LTQVGVLSILPPPGWSEILRQEKLHTNQSVSRVKAVALPASSLAEDGRYGPLIDSITACAVYMLDPSGLITSWNPDAQRIKGYESSEVLGKHFSMFYSETDQADGLPDRALETSARETTFERRGWQVRKDGSRFWAHIVINRIRKQTGELLGFYTITRDVGPPQNAWEVLKQNHDQFKFLEQHITDYAIYLLDVEGVVSSWNLGAQRIEGYRPDEVIGRHFSIFFTAEDRKNGEPARALEITAREGPFEKEATRVRKDGAVFPAHVVISPIRDDDARIIGFTKVTRDMTEMRKALQELERAREALFQAQKMEAIGQLTSEIAHDFNDILMTVLGDLEIVQRRLPKDPNITPLLENAMEAARGGKSLTQRMLVFARRRESQPETIYLSVFFEGMMEFLQRSLGPLIAIKTRLPNGLGAVHVDPAQLELVILNLFINARDATPDGGEILIEGRQKEVMLDRNGIASPSRFVCLSIASRRDEKTLSPGADPFFVIQGAGRRTGPGMAIVQGFADQSGGQFIVRSHDGKGTVAELWLPVAAGPASARSWAVEVATADELGAQLHDSRRHIVLAVGNDRLVLMDTTSMLNQLGHEVYAATSGHQALDMIRREAGIDLVIIDHAMQEMAELAEAIRQAWPNLPVTFTTPLMEASLQ
jgi:PAS domain S-box-containing protein